MIEDPIFQAATLVSVIIIGYVLTRKCALWHSWNYQDSIIYLDGNVEERRKCNKCGRLQIRYKHPSKDWMLTSWWTDFKW